MITDSESVVLSWSDAPQFDPYTYAVAEFHSAYRQPAPPFPTLPDRETTIRRINLMREELDELEEAMKSGTLEEMAKEAIDLMYVTAGTLVELGLARKSAALLAEVHRSNMSKALPSKQEAEEVAENMNAPGHHVFEARPGGLPGRYLVVRTTDGKIMKPPQPWYSPANIKPILYSQNPAQ